MNIVHDGEIQQEYLGDGIYASYDGYEVWLRTERPGGVHEIALEPATYTALLDYVKRLKERNSGK